jgi:hypothetical protein
MARSCSPQRTVLRRRPTCRRPWLCGGFAHGKQHNHHSRETKHDAEQNPKFEEPAFAKVTADRVKRRFLFHWIIMVVVETTGVVTTRVRFLPVILTSLGSQEWSALLLPESPKSCQRYFDTFPTTAHARGIGGRETTAQRDAAARTRSGAKSVRDRSSSPVTDRENLGSGERSRVSAEAWNEASVSHAS